MTHTLRTGLFVVLCISVSPTPSFSQNWSFDARRIGMGGIGLTRNVAFEIVEEQRRYRPIVLPFGLFQVLPNLPKVDPTSDEFDLARAIEYSISPIHFIIGRNDTDTASQLLSDIRNGTLSRDLNTYSGVEPATAMSAEGLASPNWGRTIRITSGSAGSFHGIYVGAGPYFSMRTSATIDPALVQILSSSTPTYIPNTSLYMSSDTLSQVALAITGGYRARLAWPASLDAYGDRDGLYLGANYHYLHGFQYQLFEGDARLDTDQTGMLTINPTLGFPVTLARTTTTHGHGWAVDVGVAAVVKHWEAGVGVNGIANRIDWTSVERTPYVLDSLFAGGDFQEGSAIPQADTRVELPVDVRTYGAYNADNWTSIVEYGHGYNGNTFRAGVEQRFTRVQLRGGARYLKERLEGTVGVGFNLSDAFGVDVAGFTTSANLERKRRLAIAVSLRFMRLGH